MNVPRVCGSCRLAGSLLCVALSPNKPDRSGGNHLLSVGASVEFIGAVWS